MAPESKTFQGGRDAVDPVAILVSEKTTTTALRPGMNARAKNDAG